MRFSLSSSQIQRYRLYLTLSLSGACTTLAHAESPELFSETDLLADIPYVSSATRLPQKITESPAALTIIDREMIDASGAIELIDLFRLVPGMQAYSVTRNRFAATYHGMGEVFPNRLEVMIDGRSIYLPIMSAVDWTSLGITLDDIDHIEVVRGSNAPAYGSNALLGAINIVTRSPVSDSERAVRVTHGNRDTKQVELRFGDTSNGHFGYQISAGYDGNDGGRLFDDAAHNRYLNFYSSYTPDLFNTLDLQFSLSEGAVEVGQADADDEPFIQRQHRSHSQMLRWHRQLNHDGELQFTLHHNYLNLSVPLLSAAEALANAEKIPLAQAEQLLQLVPSLQPLQGTYLRADIEHGTMDLYDAELEHRLRLNPTTSLVWGAGYRLEQAQSETLLNGRGRIDENHLRLFGNLQWQPSTRWTYNLGLMAEKSSLVDDPAYSPRLAANFHWSEQLTLRAALTHAHRIPSLLERHAGYSIKTNTGAVWDLISAPPADLDAEQIDSAELGLIRFWPQQNAQLDLRLFYEEISGGIDSHYVPLPAGSDIDDRYRDVRNVADWRNHGVDLEYRWQFNPGGLLVMNYSYLDQEGVRNRGQRRFTDPVDLDSLTGRSPRHTASALLSQALNTHWRVGLIHYFMSETVWLEGANFQNPRKSYQRTDLTLSHQQPLGDSSTLDLSLNVQNLFDRRYSEFYQYNYVDRRAYLTARIRF